MYEAIAKRNHIRTAFLDEWKEEEYDKKRKLLCKGVCTCIVFLN